MSTILQDKLVKTRKEHYCFSCLRRFPIGTDMWYWSGIYEGDFNSSYTCKTCKEIMSLDKENNVFEEGYVDNWLNKGQTPEELLLELKKK